VLWSKSYSLVVHQHILQLQVSVYDILLVQMVQCGEQLGGVEAGPLLGKISTIVIYMYMDVWMCKCSKYVTVVHLLERKRIE